MSLSTHRPVKGITYGVVCPACCNPMDFECVSERMYGARCPTCNAMVDLRNPAETLPDPDTGIYENDARPREAVFYSAEVEPSTGTSASAQVNNLLARVEAEKRMTMPTQMTGETKQAFFAQRQQAFSEKFSLFFPVTYVVEYIAFGREPYARIGHVRIFRKRIPFYGYVNICAPQMTTSYAAPATLTLGCFLLFRWFCIHMGLEWIAAYYYVELTLVSLFYTLLFRLAYSDPGYVKPGYMDDEGGDSAAAAPEVMTLRDIELNQRESIWEDVNGVPMERKWCSTCNMHRPVRAAHCYICGLCCFDHDHHCGVVGICVGSRRIEMFVTLVSVVAVACILPTVVVTCALWTHSEKITTPFQVVACALALVVPGFLSIVLTMTAISMCQSITHEVTTRERIQNVYAHKRNPYNRGFLGNLYYHFVQRRVEKSLFSDEFVKRCALRTQERELGTGVTVTCI
ncbi:DHHC palmitoyltransferase [Leishmania braziliensis]|nr:DHHC palmitoyltransferase [Leishmania braziliensis]